MRKYRYLMHFALLAPIILLSCVSGEIADSKDVSQSQIYTKYYINVNADESEAFTEAVFRFGGDKGTSLVLSSPSEIKVNSKTLKGVEKLFTGYHYTLKVPVPEDNTYRLNFTDIENKQYNNSFKIYPVSIPNFPSNISKNSDLNIEFSGAPIAAYEHINLNISDTAGVVVSIKTENRGVSFIKITSEKMNTLKTGPCKVQIERVVSRKNINSPEIGGLMEGKYKSIVYNTLLTN